MGQIQNAFNSSISGTAFLINQAGIGQRQREKREYKTNRTETENYYNTKAGGMLSKQYEIEHDKSNKWINRDNEIKGITDALDDLKIEKEQALHDLKAKSPYDKDRRAFAGEEGLEAGTTAAEQAWQKARNSLLEDCAAGELKRQAEKNVLDVLKNPNASKEDVMNAFKKKAEADKKVIK